MEKLLRIVKLLICIGLITVFTGCATTQKKESTGQYVDDSVITTKVKSAIFDEPSLKVFQINVKTYKGVVQLSGFVDSQQSINKAGEVARSVNGVVSVENDLNVK
ncbi:MAG: BON domain-containing protein [Proteobacteria bacterium]|nr:BON domain-containing protein [Pseudomonadota bacterium]